MSGTTAGLLGFVLLLAAALALDLRARHGGRGVTAAGAVSAAMRTTWGRAVVLSTWLWLGVHFLAR